MTEFLNGDGNEGIDIEQAEGFVDPKHCDWVCYILRLLYGLE